MTDGLRSLLNKHGLSYGWIFFPNDDELREGQIVFDEKDNTLKVKINGKVLKNKIGIADTGSLVCRNRSLGMVIDAAIYGLINYIEGNKA